MRSKGLAAPASNPHRAKLRLRQLLLGVIIALPILFSTACSPHAPATTETSATVITLQGGAAWKAGVTQQSVSPSLPVTFGSLLLCGSGSAPRVGSVSLVEPTGDLKLDRFATRPNPFTTGAYLVGNFPGSLDAAAPGSTKYHDAVQPCESSNGTWSGGSELLVELSITGPRDGCTRGLLLTYQDGPNVRSLSVPFYLGLNTEAKGPSCQ